jgi:hypothetical protein
MAIREFNTSANTVNKIYWGDAAPTAGTFNAGDIVWNDSPGSVSGGPLGWLCITGGTPGTWQGIYSSPRKVAYGTAAPVAGTWARGDIVWNTEPSAAGAPGWVCTTAGTPGTWKALANLAA